MLLLRRTLNTRIGSTGLPAAYIVKLWIASALGAAGAWLVKLQVGALHPIAVAALVLVPYGVLFLATTLVLRIPEARATFGRFRRSGSSG
jgi:putative peptidoglycan lipid II flippase